MLFSYLLYEQVYQTLYHCKDYDLFFQVQTLNSCRKILYKKNFQNYIQVPLNYFASFPKQNSHNHFLN